MWAFKLFRSLLLFLTVLNLFDLLSNSLQHLSYLNAKKSELFCLVLAYKMTSIILYSISFFYILISHFSFITLLLLLLFLHRYIFIHFILPFPLSHLILSLLFVLFYNFLEFQFINPTFSFGFRSSFLICLKYPAYNSSFNNFPFPWTAHRLTLFNNWCYVLNKTNLNRLGILCEITLT